MKKDLFEIDFVGLIQQQIHKAEVTYLGLGMNDSTNKLQKQVFMNLMLSTSRIVFHTQLIPMVTFKLGWGTSDKLREESKHGSWYVGVS